MTFKLRTILAVALAPIVLACGGDESKPAHDATKVAPKPSATVAPPPAVDPTAELSKIGARAFVWGYPAVFMERMKRTMTTNVHQPLGAFQHKSKLSAPGDGDGELVKVAALQKQFSLTTLSGKAPTMPPSPEARPQDLAFAGPGFFDELGDVVERNPPPPAMADWLAGFAKAGIGPGMKPTKKLEPKELDALASGLKDGSAEVDDAFEKLPQKKNGWDVDKRFGKGDLEPLVRAAFVKRGMDWNVAEEAFFPLTQVDDADMTLSGAHEYVLHFDKAPPVDAFWSLSMYSKRSGAFVENPLKRYSLNEKTLKKGKDGSIDVYFQVEAPKGNEANWLPTPKGEAFFVVLRMYQPKPEVLSGAWQLPAVKKIK